MPTINVCFHTELKSFSCAHNLHIIPNGPTLVDGGASVS